MKPRIWTAKSDEVWQSQRGLKHYLKQNEKRRQDKGGREKAKGQGEREEGGGG